MAVLNETDRVAVWRDFMSKCSEERQVFGALTKTNIRAAVNALDDFLNTNAAAINTAIPQPARAALTTAQKALLLQFVIQKRYIAGA